MNDANRKTHFVLPKRPGEGLDEIFELRVYCIPSSLGCHQDHVQTAHEAFDASKELIGQVLLIVGESVCPELLEKWGPMNHSD